jgi:protein-tyrosine phosphatase
MSSYRGCMRLLVICTANRCRSPMAAALLQGRLTIAKVDAQVLSAGFGPGGLAPLEEVVDVMLELGFDLRPHRSQKISESVLAASDLIIVMTRQHAMEVVLLDPASWPRTFPIIDLVRRGAGVGTIGADETLRQWATRAHGDRQRSDLLGLQSSADISDPAGAPVAVIRRTRDVLSSLVDELAQLIGAGKADI